MLVYTQYMTFVLLEGKIVDVCKLMGNFIIIEYCFDTWTWILNGKTQTNHLAFM